MITLCKLAVLIQTRPIKGFKPCLIEEIIETSSQIMAPHDSRWLSASQYSGAFSH